MNAASALGYLAGFLTTVAFLPQVVRAWRTKSTTDLSFPMLALFSTGLTLWTLYGLMLGEAPIVLFNAVTLVLTLILVAIKLTTSPAK